MKRQTSTGYALLKAALTAAASFLAVYTLAVRPRILSWGATPAEPQRALPGDTLVPQPKIRSTRALTIQAAPEKIWPWLVQIGYQRAGWYSYDALERAIGVADFTDGSSAQRLIPEHQTLKVGDIIRTDPAGGFTVTALEPNRYLVLDAMIHMLKGQHYPLNIPLSGQLLHSSWAFTLYPLGENCTRLVVRFRADYQPGMLNNLIARAALEPAIFLMERKMLLGIRQRAEA